VSNGGDGIVTLIAGVAGLLLLWRRSLGWIGQLVPAAITFLIALYDLNNAGNLAAVGIYFTFLAGAAWLVGAFMARKAPQGDVSAPVAPLGSTVEPPSGPLEP
jgi:hypothetical protein